MKVKDSFFILVTGIVIAVAIQRIVINTHLDVPLGITVGLGAGIFEEFFYRGLVLGTLMRLFSKKASKARQIWYPLLITSLIFGLDHSTNAFSQPAINTLFQVIQSFTLSLIMGALYIRSGSLIMSILFHGIWGSVAVGSGPVNNYCECHIYSFKSCIGSDYFFRGLVLSAS
ncbi:lysostaphin resistance A-like protein [Lentilactobacillus hilgardii]|uniref:CPBP family intramembrane glutamic endopeptidase n=1 Tax=Lentilactobacillus hilgardii TaxID=1588 RepID=UPI0039E85B43